MSAPKLLVISCAVLALSNLASAAAPPILRVVLHPDGAVVTRATDATCTNGTATAAFTDLLPVFDPGALRASVPAPAKVEGLAVSRRVLEEPYSEEIRGLDRQLETLRVRERSLRRDLEAAMAAEARADALRTSTMPFIAREAAMVPKPNTAAWTAALDTSRQQYAVANEKRRTAERALREVREELDELAEKRDRYADAMPREVVDAEVVVSCANAARIRAELTYTTPHARWSPAYEARAEEKSVGLTVLANAEQRTGEPWNGVEVVLSTALANRDAKPPTMQKHLVGAWEEKEQKKVLVQRQEERRHLNEGLAPGAAAEGGVPAEDHGISVQLPVPGRVDLAGDGTPARIRVETLSAPAKLGLLTIPKLAPFAFRSTEMTNTARYPLLPGPIDLFTANGFIGTWRLPRTAQNDFVRLSFGIDEAIQVKRVVLAEDKLDPAFIVGPRRLVYGYRIELRSNAKAPTAVAVHEPVPVSEIEDVKLRIEGRTTSGYRHLAADGRIEWDVPLQPGEQKTLELHFTIEVPTRYDTTGL